MASNKSQTVDAQTLKSWLHDGQEISLLDVREHGEFGESHLFYATPLPYSRLEIDVEYLVPRRSTRVVLYDAGGESDVAQRALKRLEALEYTSLHVLHGGIAAWRAAGYACFAGVNVPSKTFGELAELQLHTPHIGPEALAARLARGDNLLVLDGRPLGEFNKMNIPGSICCPNGELALRAEAMAADPGKTIVVNCAGRTRSIVGAQTLINLGIPNPVLALENGTQGWYLAGLPLEHGAQRRYPDMDPQALASRGHSAALALARRFGVKFIDGPTLQAWQAAPDRTTFLCDVRTAEEFAQGTHQGARHAPGGQLLQATDQYIGVRKARIVVFDSELVRAPVIASWLRQMGWDASVLQSDAPRAQPVSPAYPAIEAPLSLITAQDLRKARDSGTCIIDVRPSSRYRSAHIEGAVWSIRPNLRALRSESCRSAALVLIADEPAMAALAAKELMEGADPGTSVRVNLDPPDAWAGAGLNVVATPDIPSDEQCIDFLFFVHDRHQGNRAAAIQYLSWETNLVNQIDEQERSDFSFLP